MNVNSLLTFLVLLVNAFLLLSANAQTLYAHIIAHSHCDPGWLDTFEQYYRRDVSRILTGVTRALADDPSKRFVWSEISFFMRWWDSQSQDTKDTFTRLVKNGQMEFVGGGWVQNDEANQVKSNQIIHLMFRYSYVLRYKQCIRLHIKQLLSVTTLYKKSSG